MNESYEVLFKNRGDICIVIPSLELSAKKLKEKLVKSDYRIYFINYSGFDTSKGYFPGNNIIRNFDNLISEIEKSTNKKVIKIVGDSFGALIALGLLSKYKKRYSKIKIILTSPLISFNELNKSSSSTQSKEGFVRYIKKHKLVKKVNNKQLSELVNHKIIPDPFLDNKIPTKNLLMYHYFKDRNLSFKTTYKFSKKNHIKLIKLNGTKHSIKNFDKSILKEIFTDKTNKI